MLDDPAQLRPATPDEIADTLSFVLRYEGRRRGFCQVSRQLGPGLVAGSAAGRLRVG